jgi:hypothetical protein
MDAISMKQTVETEPAPSKQLERWEGDLQSGADSYYRFLLQDKCTAGGRDTSGPQNGSVQCATESDEVRLADVERRVAKIEALLTRPDKQESPVGANSTSVEASLARIANALDPKPPDVVDSPYVAGRLGCTTTRVAQMARSGDIPKTCVVPGTGNGKLWKFYRDRIDRWIESR